MTETLRPESPERVAEMLRERAEAGTSVRIRAGGTKSGWGFPVDDAAGVLDLSEVSGIVEHNVGDLTAILRAGTTLAEARRAFAEAGQMLTIDPWLGEGEQATIGGIVATGDSGPQRHRYASTRDLVLGIQLATPDGTLARAGSKVIKNVAGYDLAKLFTASYGTLGVITEVIVRLQPIPRERATAVARTDDTSVLEEGARAVAGASLELECLDVSWQEGAGSLLARCAGTAVEPRIRRTLGLMAEAGLEGEKVDDDTDLWEEQRRRQRAPEGVTIRVSARMSELARVAEAAEAVGAGLVGRAAYGVSWLRLPPAGAAEIVQAVEEVRARLKPFACVLLDAPEEVRRKVDVWHSEMVPGVELMRRIKERFDPARTCNPGIFMGGI